jgi:hypothetical protein
MSLVSLREDSAYAIALRRAGILKGVILVCWFAVPALAVTIMHPSDAAGFAYWINGLPVPHYFMSNQVMRGEVTAIFALGATIFVYLAAMVLFYRRAGGFIALWPLAALLVGVIGNLGWFIGTGAWDSSGCMAGWMPAVLAGIGAAAGERWCADLVFGEGNRPTVEADY